MEDSRLQQVLLLVNPKIAKWHRATKVGEGVLRGFANFLKGHLGYPVLSWARPVKERGRIYQKVKKHLEDVNCTKEEAAARIVDIAGGRVLVIGLEDLDVAAQHFSDFVTTEYSFGTWNFDRFVETCRRGGFRGLIGGMYLDTDELRRYPFEVQIMTPLQDTWDKLQHPVYEKVRTGGAEEPPNDVVEWFESLSERFYKLDLEISQQQRQFRSRGLL